MSAKAVDSAGPPRVSSYRGSTRECPWLLLQTPSTKAVFFIYLNNYRFEGFKIMVSACALYKQRLGPGERRAL